MRVMHADHPEIVCQVLEESPTYYVVLPSSPEAIRYFTWRPKPFVLSKECWPVWR